MRLVDQIFEIVGIAETAGRGEEVADLIAERAVERMLHDGHELHDVVARVLDVGQHVIGKLPIGGDAVLLRGHTHVRLVDEGGVVTGKALVRPRKLAGVVPHLTAPAVGDPILGHATSIQGDVLGQLAPVVDDGHDAAALIEGVAGEGDLPVPVVQPIERRVDPVPVVEVARQKDLVGCRRPLTVDPAALYAVKPVPLVRVGKLLERTLLPHELLALEVVATHAQVDVSLVGPQLGHSLQYGIHTPLLRANAPAPNRGYDLLSHTTRGRVKRRNPGSIYY